MTENKRYVRILDYSEKEVRIFDEHNQKNIFNIFFEGIDSAICLKGALEDTVDLLNELATKCSQLKKENEQLKQQKTRLLRIIENNIEIYENINTNVEFHQGEIQGKLTLLYNLREVILND